jgi:hypothetical protein
MSDETMSKGLGLIIGDVPLARFIFHDPSKRRFVPKLKADGWPIIEVAGKNAARPESLLAEAAKREREAIENTERGELAAQSTTQA